MNICGLKSKIPIPEFEDYLNSCDILGLAETKTCVHEEISISNYSYFAKHRLHYVRRSGGLGIFVKEDHLPFVEIIDTECEFLMLMKISKSLTAKDEDMIVCFVDLPPEGSDYSDSDSMSETENVVLPYIESCKYFFIMGDLNARTGTEVEFSDFDFDQIATDQYGNDNDVVNYLNNVQELQSHAIPLHRQSQDCTKNNYGRKLLQLCCNNNLYICNGRIYNDLTGAYTCTRGSVIDYLIANIHGLIIVQNFKVHEFTPLLSDVHCALSFDIEVRPQVNTTVNKKRYDT